jgi:hypothetical protein
MIAAIAAVSMIPGSLAFAADASQEVTISASVPAFCNVTTTSAMTADVPVSDVGEVDPTGILFDSSEVTCNAPYNVQVTSQKGGIKRSEEAPGGFADILDYTGTAKLGTAEASIDTSTTETAFSSEQSLLAPSSGAYSGVLDVSIYPKAAAATKPLAAGSFSDTLTVTIAPQ